MVLLGFTTSWYGFRSNINHRTSIFVRPYFIWMVTTYSAFENALTLSFYWNLKHRKLSTVVILFQVHLQCHLWCEVGGSWHRSRWADGWDWICPVTDRNPVPREQVNQRHVPGAPQQHPAQDRQTPHRNLCKCCLLMEYTVSCTLGLKMVI